MTVPKVVWVGLAGMCTLMSAMVVLFVIQLGVMNQMNSRLAGMRGNTGGHEDEPRRLARGPLTAR